MDPVKSLLVKRRALVFPPKPGSERPEDARLADAVEVEALELGYLLSGRLRVALGKLAPQQLASVHKLIFGTLAGELGSGRQHLPLFRRFPQGVPENTFNMYVRRVLAYLFQEPEQPCVLCGVEREIYALDPCGHLVCGGCFDGSNYSGCPICNRKIHPSNPFLKPAPGRRADPDNPEQVRCKLLDLGTDLMAEAGDYCQQLLCRATPMSRTERKDLEILLVNTHGGVAGWLPRRIAVKETMAVVLGGLLKLRLDPAAGAAAVRSTSRHRDRRAAGDGCLFRWRCGVGGAAEEVLIATARGASTSTRGAGTLRVVVPRRGSHALPCLVATRG